MIVVDRHGEGLDKVDSQLFGRGRAGRHLGPKVRMDQMHSAHVCEPDRHLVAAGIALGCLELSRARSPHVAGYGRETSGSGVLSATRALQGIGIDDPESGGVSEPHGSNEDELSSCTSMGLADLQVVQETDPPIGFGYQEGSVTPRRRHFHAEEIPIINVLVEAVERSCSDAMGPCPLEGLASLEMITPAKGR